MEQLYKNETNKILEDLGKELDISKSEYEAVVKSYTAVGNWLSEETSELAGYNPRIMPQGSFMLGTVVKPICDEDDIDIDLVCKLERKPMSWTQRNLKQAVGNRLKMKDTYDRMLKGYENGSKYKEGGRRCWTLKYSEVAGYHMDILPSFADENLTLLLEKAFTVGSDLNTSELAIRITDLEDEKYSTETDEANWLKSNPFGYAKWFYDKALIHSKRLFSLKESVDPVGAFENPKLPLQRVVQLLKRHRDIMFSSEEYNSENKPISIIITTLAARAYDKSENINDAFENTVKRMRDFIEPTNPFTGETQKWVSNPVNKEENFADKWSEVKQKQDYFYKWLDKLECDLDLVNNSLGKGQNILCESFSEMFGEKVTKTVFSNIAEEKKSLRESGKLKMALGTGLLGEVGTKVKNHEFFGSKNQE
ncbi:nucleotidyltransferase [Muricauda sp. TY007]|uniref:nucleotidyltransferase domain-containing protein n=1 Tax=Allomuricauda sp. TY007 TaxID=2683200 RepID=UPI0013C23726|nr:nucleotidyltransferase [Muricauda sp. TY007]NDV15782.1 nucleotidyltransferase [Muricauda sp. TY007]